MQKTEHLFQLCQTRAEYRAQMDRSSNDSGHEVARPPRAAIAAVEWGAGTELKKLLSKIGIHATPDCACNRYARTMDDNGSQWCRDNITTIVGWLEAEARKRNLPFSSTLATAVVYVAIVRAEKREKRLMHVPPMPCAACAVRDPIPDKELAQSDRAWAGRADIRERHIAGLATMLRENLPAPKYLRGDGIVYCGEGKYWPGIVIGVKLLRELGCALPIQVWHNGPVGQELRGIPGVTLVDAKKIRAAHPARALRGWEIKTYAKLHSGFRRILFLDADAYCVADPTPLFRHLEQSPFVYWDDLPGCVNNVDWPRYGVDSALGQPIPPIQGGQFLIDMSQAWRHAIVANWLNQHSDYFYQHQFGDQDSWRVAFAAVPGTVRPMALGTAVWQNVAFVCRDEGAPYVVHRCRAKLFPGRVVQKDASLPSEKRVFELYDAIDPNRHATVHKQKRRRRRRRNLK